MPQTTLYDRSGASVGSVELPDELFAAGENSAEFARTASRLTEMQTAGYLQQERRRERDQVQGVPA